MVSRDAFNTRVDIHANPIGINCPTILSTILNKETDLHPTPS